MTAPGLSVAMCTYNEATHLPAQLASIAAQTRLPDELIVCDDGSTDATGEVLRAFAAQAPFAVRLFINAENIGSTRNFEQAIGLCEGAIIVLADQDDVWLPHKLERMEATFASERDTGLVFSDAALVDAALRPLGRRLWETVGTSRSRRTLRRRADAFRALLPGWLITGATMAFRADHRPVALPIPADIPMIHDGWIALMVSAVAGVHFIDEPLMLYRQHGAQQVGARNKVRDAASFQAAARRVTSHTHLLTIVERARERLLAKGAGRATAALRELDRISAHLDARLHLPSGRLRRLPPVLAELLALRYHRYGRGIYSAAKDLLVGPR